MSIMSPHSNSVRQVHASAATRGACAFAKHSHLEVRTCLGRGAGSVIYAVGDRRDGKTYALKHVVPQGPKELRFVEQMETELHVSSGFKHPNLRRSIELKVHKTWTLKIREAFLLMELVEGTALEHRVPGSILGIVEVFAQAARGLSAMHALGFVHCDIKPNNIIHDEAGHVRVIDFGQSCKIGTVKQRIQGTADYMAPEQVKRRPVTVQTDVYNLGASLYWCLTGRHIPTLYTVGRKQENSFLSDAMIEPPAALKPQVPIGLSNLVIECVASNPAKRPASMHDVISRLEIARHVLVAHDKAMLAKKRPAICRLGTDLGMQLEPGDMPEPKLVIPPPDPATFQRIHGA